MTKTVWNSGTFLSCLSEWQIESSKEKAFIWNANLIALYIFFNVDQINEYFISEINNLF